MVLEGRDGRIGGCLVSGRRDRFGREPTGPGRRPVCEDPAVPTDAEGADDGSDAFADVERRHVREVVGVADFEWVAAEAPSQRNPVPVPLADARVTLITTAGAHEPGVRPPGAGGGAVLVPADAAVELTHPGYDTARAMADPDVVYPVRRLQALAEAGFIGSLAPTVVSTMGFVPDGRRLLSRAVPAAVEVMTDEEAHLALLVPA